MDEPILLAIIGIAVIATAAGLAPRVNIAGPLLLVMAGLGVSLLPFVPAVEVDPDSNHNEPPHPGPPQHSGPQAKPGLEPAGGLVRPGDRVATFGPERSAFSSFR